MFKRLSTCIPSHFGLVLAPLLFLALSLPATSTAKSPETGKRPAGYFPNPKDLSPEDLLPAENRGEPGDPFLSRTGVFKVKLVGYQMTRWSVHSPPDGICSGTSTGSGFERVVFRSPMKRMRLSAFGERRLTNLILPKLVTRGQLTRQGSYDYIPLESPAPDCPYGDGEPQVPTPPDCGTRKFTGVPVSLVALDGFFTLKSQGSLDQRPRFVKCPNSSTTWPSIITEKTNGKEIRSRFPANLFFNPKFDRKKKWRKVIVIAEGIKKQRTFTSASSTRLEWTLTVTRLR